MFWPFRRRRRSRLGAAVTGLPSARPVAVPLVPAARVAGVPGPRPELEPLLEPEPEPEPAPGPEPAQPRVGLVFRDGTSAELDPASAPSLALQALAAKLSSLG